VKNPLSVIRRREGAKFARVEAFQIIAAALTPDCFV
jgi:hypothetical protein